jgi:hypothetical protein
MSWTDVRWDIPDLFVAGNMAEYISYGDGFDIGYVIDQGLPIWLPKKIQFSEVLNQDVFGSTIKLREGGQLYWSQHLVVTLAQPTFDLSSYPVDSQSITLRFLLYGMDQKFCALSIKEPGVSYQLDQDKSISFTHNPIWSHKKNDYITFVNNRDLTLSPENPRIFEEGVVELYVTRESDGVLYRFALPILMLILLTGMSFWASPPLRIGVSMSLLIAVFTVYIVILFNIPLVGYLTALDIWIFLMILVILASLVMHQLVDTLLEKSETWPMRPFLARVIELIGRVVTIPLAVIIYFVSFHTDNDFGIASSIIVCTFFAGVLIRESGGVKKVFIDGKTKTILKIENAAKVSHLAKKHETSESPINGLLGCSSFEFLVYNVCKCGKWSFSLPYVDVRNIEGDGGIELMASVSDDSSKGNKDMSGDGSAECVINPVNWRHSPQSEEIYQH